MRSGPPAIACSMCTKVEEWEDGFYGRIHSKNVLILEQRKAKTCLQYYDWTPMGILPLTTD